MNCLVLAHALLLDIGVAVMLRQFNGCGKDFLDFGIFGWRHVRSRN